MGKIVWRSFNLDRLFEFSSGNTIALKDYNLSDQYSDGFVEVVTSSKDNMSNSYMNVLDVPSSCPIYENSLTINRNGSIGYCHYHKNKFIIPTGDSYTLLHRNEKLKNVMDKNAYNFFAIIITHIFTKSVFGYSYKVNSERFGRELILLPCLEVAKDEEHIWEEDGHCYTLAVEYIKELMDKAKEEREKNTIRLYEAERAKYEAERAKYEAEYKKEKESLVWKGFKLGSFLEYSSKHVIKGQIKNLQVYEKYEEGTVANVTASKENNGIVGYIEETDEIRSKKIKDVLTIASDAAYAGICFYQDEYIISTGHNKLIEISSPKLKTIFDKNKYLYLFLAALITKTFCKTFYGFSKSITEDDFAKSLILLPCLEVAKDEEHIWEEDGHCYTLAVEYISYLYLTGKVNYNQNLIDTYTYNY